MTLGEGSMAESLMGALTNPLHLVLTAKTLGEGQFL